MMVEHAKPGDKVLVSATLAPEKNGDTFVRMPNGGAFPVLVERSSITTEAEIRADERAKLAALTMQSGADQAAWAFVTQHMPDASEVQALAAVHDLTQMLLFAANMSACLTDKHEGGAG